MYVAIMYENNTGGCHCNANTLEQPKQISNAGKLVACPLYNGRDSTQSGTCSKQSLIGPNVCKVQLKVL